MPVAFPKWKKLLSYVLPISIKTIHSQYTQHLKLVLFKNQLMLTTPKAMYSNGVHYSPFLLSFKYLHTKQLLHPQQVLILGGALLSALQILHQKYAIQVTTTVVEIDGKFQQLITDYLPTIITKNIQYHHQDAAIFMQNCTTVFDMICIDIFIDLQMPNFVLQQSFMQKCKKCLAQKGVLILNTYFEDEQQKNDFKTQMETIFTNLQVLQHVHNYIFVAINV
jgi:spermidine synthase